MSLNSDLLKYTIENYFPKLIDAYNIIQQKLDIQQKNNSYYLFIDNQELKINPNIYVISVGKVALRSALGLMEKLKNSKINIQKFLVITDKKYIPEEYIDNKEDLLEILISTHPYLSEQSIDNTEKLIKILEEIDNENTSLIFLISGGTSSIIEYPIIKKNTIIELYKYLINQDLNIHKMNKIRSFFSMIKRGKLLQYIKHSQVISLIFSDVPFNDLSSIGSGITNLSEDLTSIDTVEFVSEIVKPIIDHFNIHQSLRKNFEIYQNIKNNNKNLNNIYNFILADNTFALKKTEETFLKYIREYNIITLTSHLSLNINKLIDLYKGLFITNKEKDKVIFLFGGETSLKVKKEGYGGRLQHLSLELLKEFFNYEKEIIFFGFSTDGIDGNTKNSGFILSNKINLSLEKIHKYLENFNSGIFFDNPKNNKYSIKIPSGLNNLNEIYGIVI